MTRHIDEVPKLRWRLTYWPAGAHWPVYKYFRTKAGAEKSAAHFRTAEKVGGIRVEELDR